MSHYHKAEERSTEFYFEICDSVSCTCTGDELAHHRAYRWGKDSSTMTSANMIEEVHLLEELRQSQMTPVIVSQLAQLGREV